MVRLAIVTLLALPLTVGAAAPPPVARDADGVALPPGARLRLGKAQWRVGKIPLTPVFSQDHRWLAHHEDGEVRVHDLRTRRCQFVLSVPWAEYIPLAFTHDGRVLAVRKEQGGPIVLWRVGHTKATQPLNKEPIFTDQGMPACAAFLPGDKRLATWNGKHLSTWDVATGKRLSNQPCKACLGIGSFSPDGKRFAYCTMAGSLEVADLICRSWRRICLPETKGKAKAAAWTWSADGRLLVVGISGVDGLFIHKADTGDRVSTIHQEGSSIAAFSPDGSTLALAVRSLVHFHEVASGRLLHSLDVERNKLDWVRDLWYQDNKCLLVQSNEGFIRPWHVRKGTVLEPNTGHWSGAEAVAFGPGGGWLLSLDCDGTFQRWETRTGRASRSMRPRNEGAYGKVVSVSRCGQFVAMTTAGSDVVMIDLSRERVAWEVTGSEQTAPGTQHQVYAATMSPDASLVLMPARQPNKEKSFFNFELRRVTDGAVRRAFSRTNAGFFAFSPDSSADAIFHHGWNAHQVDLIDLRTGKPRRQFRVPREQGADASPNLMLSIEGCFIAGASGKYVSLWERASGQLLDTAVLPEKTSIRQLTLSPDGRLLVLALLFGNVNRLDSQSGFRWIVWELATRKIVRQSLALQKVSTGTLCARGHTLAVGCDDSSILLYDIPQSPHAPKPPATDVERNRLWSDLASADARVAWRAQDRLAASPATVALLAKQLRPAHSTIKELADLDTDDFTAREAATKKLTQALKRGDNATEYALRDLMQRKPSLEAHRRAERLLAQVGPINYSNDELRAIRAVAVLEHIATPDAVAVLRRLAAGTPAVVTAEAKAALRRLDIPRP